MVLIASSLLLFLLSGLGAAQSLPAAEQPFALQELEDPLHDIVLPTMYAMLEADVSPTLADATLINRFRFIVSLAMFDAAAPYHPTAVGMYTRIERRPENEWTDANINQAMLRAAYQALRGLLPEREPVWRNMLASYGLDPDNASADLRTPAGIGNAAGIGAIQARFHDGINQAGDYLDTTGYAPVNSAYELRDASRWQPGLRRLGIGVYSVQQFVTPQLANMEPMALFNPRELRVENPSASAPENWEAYIAQVDQVLAASANLSEEQKLKAELFDNKVASLGFSYLKIADDLQLSPADIVRGYFLKASAWMDASIMIWQEKARFDAVRPFSAIAHVYGDEPVTAWGGPGQGTQTIPASQWQAYLPEADHPEYPSGTTCGCYAHAQALRRLTGTDELNWSVSYPAGTSRIEPGVTPARDTTLTFATWTDFAKDCGDSRNWSGVHFLPAVENSAESCNVFGDMAYEYFLTLMDGTAPPRQPAQATQVDPWLLAARQSPPPLAVVPENTYPTPLTCENISASVEVSAINNGIVCAGVDLSGLSTLGNLLDAVSISGALHLGAQVCFDKPGTVASIQDEGATMKIVELTSYNLPNRTCAWVDEPGTLVLVPAAHGLLNCTVTVLENLRLRRSPGDGAVITIVPANARLLADRESGDWLHVSYEGRSGWVSALYVTAEGSC
ncbi:MAG: hypothetical protein OXG92_06255 [Chloroflexi bacterium]|nr:hypothetical protein [Chloroflexota bacterium]MCY3583180.1 hypothetical protein [Chloroflexota bacterium]MCY3716048.1 hypothetical protein [Chloroflexota bacterium]MDE2651369.1 hypothetical protein [Chloroflexota bacterium]MXX84763.1 hypothetical protein [Chloroflexota bacterium]